MNDSVLGAVRRRWFIVAVFVLVGAVFGALPQPAKVEEQVRTFSATHTMLLNDDLAIQGGGFAVSPNQVPLFIGTGEVPNRVADAIDFDGNAASLAGQVTSAFDFGTGALTISTTQGSGQRAELIANAFAQELNSYLAERQDAIYVDRQAAASQRLAELESALNRVTGELARSPESPTLAAQQSAISRQYSVAFEQSEKLATNPPVLGFTTLQRAEAVEITERGLSAPTSRSSRAILGALVGAAIGVGIVLLLGLIDRRLRSREQAESVLDMRARVLIPKARGNDRDRMVVNTGRHDPLSDSYRTVRNVVGFVLGTSDPAKGARVTLIVSPGPGDGKTSLAANLAAAMAESGERTILVNTDFRRPRLASTLGGAAAEPQPFALDDLDRLDVTTLLRRTDRTNLQLFDLSTIEASTGELVRATIDKLADLSELADSIVIDTSPVGATAEVLEVVPYADVIAVVARVGRTHISASQRTIAILRDLSTAPMILVLNGMKTDRDGYYEYTDRTTRRDGPAGSIWRRRSRSAKNTAPDRQLEPVE
jgi:polysaccharide biosynthesis transport protein